MRTTLLAAASVVALTLGTTAWADQAASPAGDSLSSPAAGAGQQQTTGATTGSALAAGQTHQDPALLPQGSGRGYYGMDEGMRAGLRFSSAQDDWDAADLQGATIVDSQGEVIGSVDDLFVADDDSIGHVVVRLDSAATGGQEEFVVVSLDELQRAEGDAGNEFVLSRGVGGFHEGDYFDRQDDRWMPRQP